VLLLLIHTSITVFRCRYVPGLIHRFSFRFWVLLFTFSFAQYDCLSLHAQRLRRTRWHERGLRRARRACGQNCSVKAACHVPHLLSTRRDRTALQHLRFNSTLLSSPALPLLSITFCGRDKRCSPRGAGLSGTHAGLAAARNKRQHAPDSLSILFSVSMTVCCSAFISRSHGLVRLVEPLAQRACGSAL
jgi:hypothetical protein